MVGDSLTNDVRRGAEAIGMRALLIGTASGSAGASPASRNWPGLPLGRRGAERAADRGRRRRAAGRPRGAHRDRPRSEVLADGEQGRYNLVGAAGVEWPDGAVERALPEALPPSGGGLDGGVHARGPRRARDRDQPGRGRARAGAAAAVGGGDREKIGVVVPEPELAFEIGRHGASALLLANADLRPRNTFLIAAGRPAQLTMVDYEYSLFDPALDLSASPGGSIRSCWRAWATSNSPRGSSAAWSRRARSSARAAPSSMPRVASPEVLAAFRAGWHDVHQAARRNAGAIADLLYERGAREPHLVIGTEAYRRAFLPLDVRDILERIAGDPDEACSGAL